MITKLTLIRHGHVYNPDRILYGRLPRFRLSEIGRKQAVAAAQAAAQLNPTAIYHSPLLRARQTAAIIAAVNPAATVHQDKRLIEVHSNWDGRPISDLIAQGWDIYTNAPAGYDQPATIIARVQRFAAFVQRKHAGEHVVAVSHGDILAFSYLWASRHAITAANKATLEKFGLSEPYPATASFMTLTLAANTPPTVAYHRPYGDDLVADHG